MKRIHLFIFSALSICANLSLNAQTVTSEQVLQQRIIEQAVTYLYEVLDDGTIEGELLNTTAQRVSDIEVLVRYSWVWARESNKDREDLSWANTFTFPVSLKPGDTSPLSIPPLRPMPARDDGKFLISAKVMGYTRFSWVEGE